MNDLTAKRCLPCEAGVKPIDPVEASKLLQKLTDWQLDPESKFIQKNYSFKNFYHTMAFTNAIAWIANQENHHPDLEIGYNYCRVRYTTHAIEGLSVNDFICAAKIDELSPGGTAG